MFNWTVSEEDDCSTSIILWLGFAVVINAVLILSSIGLTYKFVVGLGEDAKKVSKFLYYSGLSYFILSTITLILSTPINFYCSKSDIMRYADRVHKILYSVQCYFYIVLWFLRLYFAFRGTAFELSKCALTTIITFAMIGFVSLLYAMIFHDTHTNFGFVVTGCLILLFIAWIMFLVSLFIYKLINVYKNVSAENNGLIRVITKITILSIVSICSSFLYLSIFFIARNKNIHLKLARDYMQLVSTYMNFICVLLSYNCFDAFYGKSCGKMDIECTKCWSLLAGKNR